MLIINWKQTAINELESITTYIFDHNPIAALTLENEILQTAERLADMPYSGRLGRVDGTREKILHPNYLVVYQVTSTAINILNILHTKREYP
mgnify:CR=1 FL=1